MVFCLNLCLISREIRIIANHSGMFDKSIFYGIQHFFNFHVFVFDQTMLQSLRIFLTLSVLDFSEAQNDKKSHR